MPTKKKRSIESLHDERQEWLGDALLQFLSSRLLYRRHPHLSEGALSLVRESLVSGGALAAAARASGLAQTFGGDELSDSVLAGKTEEYFARCYLDGGLTAADDAMQKLLGNTLAEVESKIAAGATLKSPKTTLQEITQSGGGNPPDYVLLKKTGKDHNLHFWVECRATDSGGKEVCAQGDGKTLRAAEQNAAEKCMRLLTNE